MKFIGQTFLITFFVGLYTVLLLAVTVKFNILNYTFWTTSFKNHNVYQKLSEVVKNYVDTQVGKGGGDKKDIAILTDLITPVNTADFVNTNLLYVLNFVNGKTTELKVYVPVDKVPEGLIPAGIIGLNKEMTINELGSKLSIEGLDAIPYKEISTIGVYDYYLLMIVTTLMGIILMGMILLVEAGKRLVAVGLAFILSGSLTLFATHQSRNLNTYLTQNFLQSTSINKMLVVTVVPPVLSDISQIWIYLGIILIVGGLLMFILKKPSKKITLPPKIKSVLLPD